MTNDILSETKKRMSIQLDHLKDELRGLRAGRASPALLEPVMVDVYGSQMRIKELGTISSPEPRQLVISPFDTTNAGHIAKAIEKANLGLRAILEGKTVRINLPELTQERRKELVSQCHDRREKCKVAIRNVRRDQNEDAKKKKTASIITEDDLKKIEKQIQELTDKSCKEADDICAAKEKEISTV